MRCGEFGFRVVVSGWVFRLRAQKLTAKLAKLCQLSSEIHHPRRKSTTENAGSTEDLSAEGEGGVGVEGVGSEIASFELWPGSGCNHGGVVGGQSQGREGDGQTVTGSLRGEAHA